jgi:hypothetical protein
MTSEPADRVGSRRGRALPSYLGRLGAAEGGEAVQVVAGEMRAVAAQLPVPFDEVEPRPTWLLRRRSHNALVGMGTYPFCAAWRDSLRLFGVISNTT